MTYKKSEILLFRSYLLNENRKCSIGGSCYHFGDILGLSLF